VFEFSHSNQYSVGFPLYGSPIKIAAVSLQVKKETGYSAPESSLWHNSPPTADPLPSTKISKGLSRRMMCKLDSHALIKSRFIICKAIECFSDQSDFIFCGTRSAVKSVRILAFSAKASMYFRKYEKKHKIPYSCLFFYGGYLLWIWFSDT